MQNNSQPQTQFPTPATDAARSGLVFGLLLTIIFALWAYSVRFPILVYPFLLSLPLVPLVAFRLSRRYLSALDQKGIRLSFMPIWAHTLMLFFFSSLVLMLPMYYYVRMMLPGTLDAMEQMMQELFRQTPDMRSSLSTIYGQDPLEALDQLRNISIWSYLMTMLNIQVTIGAIIGLINAALLYKRKK